MFVEEGTISRETETDRGEKGRRRLLVVFWLGLQVFTAWVQFLVREQRFHKPQVWPKRRVVGRKQGRK